MDANIVSFVRLSDNDQAVRDFKKKHKDWFVVEVRTENKVAPFAAISTADEATKTLTLNYVPAAAVMPLTGSVQ